MKSKIPKYCHYCGSKVSLYLKIAGYSEATGKPKYVIGIDCTSCRSKGIIVYFREYYSIPKGFDISNLEIIK